MPEMAKAEFYRVNLKCPHCGHIGSGDASHIVGEEARESYHLENLSVGFFAVHKGVTAGTALVHCQCGNEFRA
jgi:hypothetical protein